MQHFLLIYYGIIQTIHMLGNAGAIFGDRAAIFQAVSPLLTPQQIQILFFSTMIDFFIASPAALIFMWGYWKKQAKFEVFLDISLNVAAISAFFYVYELMVMDAWRYTPLNTFIAIAFLPIIPLYTIYVFKRIQGKAFIAKKK